MFRKEEFCTSTHLIVSLVGSILEIDCLLEDVTVLVKFDALGPVVKGSGNVDFFGRVFPKSQLSQRNVSERCCTRG